MKKKNWLMTIAFAVLALTIVSTCVIGSTYAKFTSKVEGSGTAQAAGFLVTGSTADVGADLLIAPGVSQNVTVTINYFSQVATDITVANTNDTAHNTGVFTATNWAALRDYYVANKAAIQARYGITAASETSAQAVVATGEGATEVADLISVNTAATAAALCADIYKDDNAKFSSAYSSGTQLPAMIAGATAAATGSVTVAVTWNDAKYGDSFDTFVGECIAKLAQAAANGSVDIMTIGSGTGATLSLTAAAAHQTSLVATNVAVTATQHTAAANSGS